MKKGVKTLMSFQGFVRIGNLGTGISTEKQEVLIL